MNGNGTHPGTLLQRLPGIPVWMRWLTAQLVLLALMATAARIHAQGGVGYSLYGTGGDVQVTILPASAGATSTLSLVSPKSMLIGSNRDVGKIVKLGKFPKGTELNFALSVSWGGNTYVWSTGPGSRNADGMAHVQIASNGPGVATVGFEDLPQGLADWDYNDCMFEFKGVQPKDLAIDITAQTQRPKMVQPGETYHYNIHGTLATSDPVKTFTLNSQLSASATAAQIVPSSVTSGGTVNGQRISWTFPGTNDVTVGFDVKMADLDKLPPNLTTITDTVDGKVVMQQSGTVITGKNSLDLKVARFPVQGTVRDVLITGYPQKRNSLLLRPLVGGDIQLLRASDQSKVDSDTTDKNGDYAVTAMEPGDYIVEVSKKGDVYDSASNSISQASVPIVQRRSITIPDTQTTPVKMDDILLPLDINNFMAQKLHGLNNLKVPFQSGAVTIPLMKFNTSRVDAFMHALVGNHDEVLNNDFQPGGSPNKDQWNATIRLAAALAMIEARYDNVVPLADDVTKMAALLITQEMIKHVAKILKFPGPANVVQAQLRDLKVNVMVIGVGTILPHMLDSLGITGQKKALAMEVLAKSLRFAMDFFTNQWLSDAVFEVIFDGLRARLMVDLVGFIMTGYGDPGQQWTDGPWQKFIDDSVDKAQRRVYSRGEHNATLVYLDKLNDDAGQRVLNVHTAAISTTQFYSVMRGLSGSYQAQKTALRTYLQTGATGAYPTNIQVQAFMGKITSNAWFKIVTVGSVVATFALPFAEMWVQEAQLDGIVQAAFAGPVPGPGPVLTALSTPSPEAAAAMAGVWAGSNVIPMAPPPPDPAVQQYLNALKPVRPALQKKNGPAYAAARDALMEADRRLFDEVLWPVAVRCQAAMADPDLSPDVAAKANRLAEALDDLSLHALQLYAQLELWAQDPKHMSTEYALAQIDPVSKGVSAAGTACAQAAAALSGKASPGALLITEGNTPQSVLGGTSVELKFTFRNVGDTNTASVPVVLLPADGLLTLVSPPQQMVPGLAPAGQPGDEVELTWTVQANPIQKGQIAGYEVLANSPEARAAYTQGSIAVFPQ